MIYAINRKTKEHRIAKPATTWSGYDWELVEADDDGWIEWSGGECPLPVGAEVDIKTKDARCPNGENTMTCFASTRVFSDWVIAYRPILEPQSEQVKEWPADYEAHKKNTETLLQLTEFLVKHGIGNVGESSVDVAIRELSEKHDILTDRERWIEAAREAVSNANDYLVDEYEAIYDAGLARLPG